jgi:hypothetical protein
VDQSANEKKKEKNTNQLTVASCLAFVSKAQHEEKGRPPSICEREGVPSVRGREQSARKKKKKRQKKTNQGGKGTARGTHSHSSQEQSAKNEKEIKTNQKKKIEKSSGVECGTRGDVASRPRTRQGKGVRLRARGGRWWR